MRPAESNEDSSGSLLLPSLSTKSERSEIHQDILLEACRASLAAIITTLSIILRRMQHGHNAYSLLPL